MAWEYTKEQNITIEILNKYYQDIKETFCKNIELPETLEIDIKELKENSLGNFELINQKPYIHISSKLIENIKNCEFNSLVHKQYVIDLIHTIHHEICHYEIEKKLPFIRNFLQLPTKPLEMDIYLYCYISIFNEFMASNLSKTSFKFSFQIERLKQNTKLSADEYINSNKNFYKLMHFGKDFAYLLGYLSNDGYIDKFISEIQNKILHIFCIDTQKSLINIGNKYPLISKQDVIESAVFLGTYFEVN